MMRRDKAIKNSFTRQHDTSDCGVACLTSIVKFHGGKSSFEHLRKLSGTSSQGTSLLGLKQAAEETGFVADGFQAESEESLRDLNEPAILHIITPELFQHYVVFYGFEKEKLIIGDPARGIKEFTKDELSAIWKSRTLLKLEPGPNFQRSIVQDRKRKQWIFGLIKDDLNILTMSLVLGVIISIFGISTAVFSQKLIDEILPTENTEKLIISLGLLTLLLLVRSGLAVLRGVFMVRQGMLFNNRIIKTFYHDLLSLPKSFFDARKTGDLIARMNDTRRIQMTLSAIFGNITIDVLILIVSITFVFAYSSLIGCVILMSLPVYFLVLLQYNKPVVDFQKEVMSTYAAAESNFIDTIQGVNEIKSTDKRVFFEKLNSKVYGVFQQKVADLGKLQLRFGLVCEIVGVFLIVIIFGISSWLVISRQLLVGEMVALLGMASAVAPCTIRLIVSNLQIQEALIAFDRMYEFVSLEKEFSVDHGLHKSIGLKTLNIDHLSFRFPGRKQVLKNITMQVRQGEMVAVMGESGQGKSTLLQLLLKFYSPESGNILIDGNNLAAIPIPQWRRDVAYVPQEAKIFNGNLIYNIVLSDQLEDVKGAITFCETSGFGKYFSELPQGYLTIVGEEGANLSGGQKQLVVLARALFRKPKLLLLDEATSALDKKTEVFVLEQLKATCSERITILVTHRFSSAQVCHKVLILEFGTITVNAPPSDLMNFNNVFSNSINDLLSLAPK
jgi:ABC-type bacteriocin/lantibiotic exporter with double-glycine peptidase domain